MIKKRLRVSPGSWMPLLASLFAIATAASLAVFFRVTMEQARFVPRILNPQADIDGNALETMPWIGWCLMFGGLVLMVLFLWFAAKKAVGLMAIPALLYAVGAVLENLKGIQNNTISTEQWVILIGIILVSWWFIMTVTNLVPGKIPAKELLILLAVIAAGGVAVLTFLQRAPFVIHDSCFAADNCLDVSSLVQVGGYFLTIVLFSVSLDNSFQTEVSAAGKDSKSAAGDRAKSGGRKQGSDAKEPKSDGKTVNWALIRPAEENAKKAPEAAPVGADEPAVEITGAESGGMESLDEANRRIAEMTANGPTFEEEMNLVGEIGERKNQNTMKPDAAKNREGAKRPAEEHVFAAEPGVEVVQYAAPAADDTPSEEKTLAQLLAERGLLNRTEDPIAQADAIKADEAIYAPYVEPVQEAKPLEAPKAEWDEGVTTIEETAEAVADTVAEADAVAEAAGEAVETAADAAADAAEKAVSAADKAADAAEKAADAEKKAAEAAAGAATAFSRKAGRKTVYDELEETPEEADDGQSAAFAAKGKGTQNRVREAAEKVSSDEPILTVPVTPVSGSRLQKVLKEEVITDRDQKLMYRRKVSVFAVIGMCLSVAAMVVGVLTTFDIVKIDMLKDDKTCLMMLGLGLVMFLIFGTRLTYKDYYTKTIVTERKVVHEESNWEEYVANRLEEDEKNISALAQNYMRMTEMYGRLLETTAELTNNIKSLSVRQQAGIAAAEPEPAAAETEVPAGETEKPVIEEEFAEEPIKLMAVPGFDIPAPAEESETVAEPEFTAAEEPVVESVEEAFTEAAEAPVAEAYAEEEFSEEPIKLMAVPGFDIPAPAEEPEAVAEAFAEPLEEVAEAVEAVAEEPVAETPVAEEFAEEPIKLMAVPNVDIPAAVEEVAAAEETAAEAEIAEAVEEVAAEATEAVTEAAEEVAAEPEIAEAVVENVEEVAAEAVEEVAAEATEAVEEVAAEAAETVEEVAAEAEETVEGIAAEAAEAVTEEPVAEAPAEEESAAEAPAEEAPKSTSGNANADILAALFSGRGKKTAAEPAKTEKPAEATPAPEPVKKETEEESKPTGSYNDFLLSTMFGRKKDKPASAAEEPVKAASEEIVEQAVEEVAEAAEEIPEAAAETVEEVTEVAEEIPEVAAETVEEVTEAAEEIPEAAAEAVEEVTEAAEEIPEAAAEAVEEVTEATEEISETAAEAVEEITEATEEIPETVAEAVEEVTEAAEEIPEAAEEAVTEFTEQIPEIAEEAQKDTFIAFDISEDERIPEYVSSPIGTTSDAVKAVTDSIQTPTWSIPSPMFGSFGYGATLAEEESEEDGGMKLQFSSNTMQEPMFNDEPLQNVFTPNSFYSEESVMTPTSETPAVDPFADEPQAEEPVTEEPVAEEPVAEEPVAEEPVAEELAVEEPTFEEPTFDFIPEEPVAEEPAVEEPAFEEPAFDFTPEEPVAEEPAAEEPAVEEPAFDFTPVEPVTEEPAFEKPAFDFTPEEPAAEEPAAEKPAFEEPVAEEPAVEEPTFEEPALESFAAEEPVIAEEAPVVKPEVPEWKPAEEQKKAPFYRPSIYSSDSPEDAVNDEEMPQVTVPTTPQRENAPKQDDGIIEGFVMPTFRGFTYSDDYEPTDDDPEEQMYNGSYKMKSFLSRKTAQSEQMNQYLYDSDDDDDFGIGADDAAGGQYHGAEIPATAVEDENDMFAEPELPMTEADFAEPELPELETETWEEAHVPEPAVPSWDNSLTWRPDMSSIDDLQETEIPEPAAPAMNSPYVPGMGMKRPETPDTAAVETGNKTDEAPEDTEAKPATVLNRQSAISRMSMAGRMPVMPETSLEDDWPMGTPSHQEEEKKPEPEESEEDARTRLENRRRMLQEKLDQIRKKNQATQFDDLSDLDDEGVFFNKK